MVASFVMAVLSPFALMFAVIPDLLALSRPRLSGPIKSAIVIMLLLTLYGQFLLSSQVHL